jgi:hypothetical protein
MDDSRRASRQRVVVNLLSVSHFGVATLSTSIQVTCETVKPVGPVVVYEATAGPAGILLAPEQRRAHVH